MATIDSFATTNGDSRIESTMDQTKITASVYSAHLVRFEKDLRDRFMKRDSFLNQMIKVELPNLKADMEGKVLTSAAHRHISKTLKAMGTTPVNIVVDKAVAYELNAVVKEHNMVRDAFINYLLLCLRSTDNFLRHFDLPVKINQREFDALMPPMPVSPIAAIGEVMWDPFCYLREAVSERLETGLYTIPLPKQYHGFSCFLADEDVPGTDANLKSVLEQKELGDSLLKELEELDESAFGQKAGEQK